MALFDDLLNDPTDLLARIDAYENAQDRQSPQKLSAHLGDADYIKLYQMRRLATFLIWDIQTASAIAHYRKTTNAEAPQLNANGVVVDTLPKVLADRLEQGFLDCPIVPWTDTRPCGYSYFPFAHTHYFECHEPVTIHRTLTPELNATLNEALSHLAPQIEGIMGHYWTAGAARVYAAKPQAPVAYHSDLWPLGLKKIMFYPSGAGIDKGTTEIILADGSLSHITGGKGVWAIFDNTLRQHRALVPETAAPRPTIELAIIPAFQTDPVVRQSGIHVGFPWLPPELDSLTGDTCATSFGGDAVKSRTLLRLLMLGQHVPQHLKIPDHLKGLGFYD